jgi:hypothetical protein
MVADHGFFGVHCMEREHKSSCYMWDVVYVHAKAICVGSDYSLVVLKWEWDSEATHGGD